MLCVELFAGSFGWTAGWLEFGGRAVGFDLEHLPHHGPVPANAELVIQDVRTLHGAQFRNADLILASPPCQEFSYRAMPWKRSKALGPPVLGIELFWHSFRIQHEASEAAGRYIPTIVENVKGAQPWVGRARWHYGSFYLWGDVPALMPHTFAAQKFNPDGTTHGQGSWFAIADSKNRGSGVKVPGIDFSGYGTPGYKAKGFNVTAAQRYREGVKVPGNDKWFDTGIAKHSSRSDSRKAASAAIARIPLELSRHIARCFKP